MKFTFLTFALLTSAASFAGGPGPGTGWGCSKDDALSEMWSSVKASESSGWRVNGKPSCSQHESLCSGPVDGSGNWGWQCNIPLCGIYPNMWPGCNK